MRRWVLLKIPRCDIDGVGDRNFKASQFVMISPSEGSISRLSRKKDA